MSDLNFSLTTAKPIIREAANMQNDGGGGNLGYMQQKKKNQKEKRQTFDESIFGRKEEDVFMSEKSLKYEEEKGTVNKFLGGLINRLKSI